MSTHCMHQTTTTLSLIFLWAEDISIRRLEQSSYILKAIRPWPRRQRPRGKLAEQSRMSTTRKAPLIPQLYIYLPKRGWIPPGQRRKRGERTNNIQKGTFQGLRSSTLITLLTRNGDRGHIELLCAAKRFGKRFFQKFLTT